MVEQMFGKERDNIQIEAKGNAVVITTPIQYLEVLRFVMIGVPVQ